MQIINVAEAKTHLSALINSALAGEEVIIAKAGLPAVRLTPIEQKPKPRVGGQWRGQIWMSPDCWDPDPELEDLMNNGPIFPDEPKPEDK